MTADARQAAADAAARAAEARQAAEAAAARLAETLRQLQPSKG
jgi:hypothetical protein